MKLTDEDIKNRKRESELPKRHRVGFIKTLELQTLPQEAYATLGASQAVSLWVNGKEIKPAMADGRVGMYDLKARLRIGVNHIVIDVSSHTEKAMNESEREQFPASRNHLNSVSGVAFYLRATFDAHPVVEIISDTSWQTRRAPEAGWKDVVYDASNWQTATALPADVEPIDEGPSLPPIQRKDFANEPLQIAPTFRRASSTAAQPGGIRAALLAGDPLMTALDRPNREQVMTSRSAAATTLQALALTNGSSLDARLKQLAARLAPAAAKDAGGFVKRMYRHSLGREPSAVELNLSLEILGTPVKPEGVADFIWGVTLLPEFQFIN